MRQGTKRAKPVCAEKAAGGLQGQAVHRQHVAAGERHVRKACLVNKKQRRAQPAVAVGGRTGQHERSLCTKHGCVHMPAVGGQSKLTGRAGSMQAG